MLEVPPLVPSFPVQKNGQIKKEHQPSEHPQGKKKQRPQEQEDAPLQHIDEIV